MGRWARTGAIVTAAAVAAAGMLVPAGAASAAGWQDLVTVTADEAPSWQTNGIAWVVESVGDVVYVGGTFTKVRPPGVAAGGAGEVNRTNFAAFDAVTGDLLPCAPTFTLGTGTATVRALEGSPDGTRLYVGGGFSAVNGTGVANIASIDTASCALTATGSFRRPAVTATVRAISATSDAVYFGGDFTTVDGQTRPRFAMVTAAGALTPSTVTLNLPVRAVLAAPDAGKVIIGGDFTTVNGASVRGLVSVSPTTGAVVQTYPGWIPTNSVAKVLVRDAQNFYVGAEGTGGGVFDGRIGARLSDGAQLWKDNCLGATQALAVHDGVLYGGHHAHDCSTTPGGFADGKRFHLLAQSTADMTILPWTPNTDGGLGEALGPRSMVMGGGQLWVVGEFLAVNGRPQQGITRFPAGPDTGYVDAPLLTAKSEIAGKVTVSWTAGWDLDDDKVTYELFRSGTAEPISVQTASSREWDRPRMSFTDTVPAGTTVSYSMRTSDGTNVSPKGAAVSVTVASTSEPYRGPVSSDAPIQQWRLDETSGTTAADSSGSNRTGSYANVQLNQASALTSGAGRSASFNGSSSRVNTTSTVKTNEPRSYSLELWFRTTSTRGGKLIGYGNSRTGNSSSYDRHLYLNNSGNVLYGNYDGATRTLKSPSTYRDGQWHHVVGTTGPEGMRLYVDGRLVGSNATTAGQRYLGWWSVGGDNLNSWPETPSSRFFNGGIDEVSIYDKQLTPARVFTHFAEGRPSGVNDTQAPTTPSGLTASAASAVVSASWTASTDNYLVAGYQVHRSRTSGFTPDASTLVGTSDYPRFSESGVDTGTWYYRVVAFDGTGRTSGASNQATVNVTDNQAPTAPGSPTAAGYGSEVDVAWAASSDDTAVTGYQVHRLSSASATPSAATLVGQTLGTSFTDTGVPPGTWFYKVVALDAAGNASAPSAPAQALAQSQPSSIDIDGTDALAPTPTFSSAHPASGASTTIPGAVLVQPEDARLTYLGATGFVRGTVYPDTLFAMPTSRYPGQRGSQPTYAVDFTTDASVFEVYTKYLNATQQTIQVKVDGHRTTVTPRLVGGTNLGSRLLYKVDLGSSATRRITLETSYNPFGGIWVPAGASVTKSPVPAERWLVMGDSISGGSAENTGAGNGTWVQRTGDYLGWRDGWNQSIGGTGYVATSGSSVAIPARTDQDVVAYAPDHLVLWAGYNDQLESQSSIASAASQTLQKVATGSPGTSTYVVGPWSKSGTPVASLTATDETLRQVAAQAGVPFVSPRTGTVYGADGQVAAYQRPWITGTGNAGAPNGTGNADQYVSQDGVHPTDAGHRYIAQRMALALEQVLGTPAPGDTTPPSAPTGVVAQATGSSVQLSWTAATDDVAVTGYDVHRGATADFVPAPGNRVGQVTGTTAGESGVAAGSWYYRVVARDAAGNVGQPSTAAPVTVAEVVQPQTVVLGPTADSYVNFFAKTTNYGSSQSMLVDGDPQTQSFLRFELPAAPAGLTLTSASLALTSTAATSATSVDPLTVSLATDAWTETTVTWNDRPTVGATLGTLGSVPALSTRYETALDVAQLQSLAGSTTIAVTMVGGDNAQFFTRQYGGAAQRPVLVLNYS